MATLSEEDLRKAGKGVYRFGDGLQLEKSSVERGKWIYRYQFNKSRHDMGMGPWPAVSLAAARKAAKIAMGMKAQGIDPKKARDQARDTERRADIKISTFGEVADIVVPIEQARSTNQKVKYQKQYLVSDTYCKAIRNKPINEITTNQLATMLRPLWRDKPEVARKLFPLIRRVFDHGRILVRDDYGLEFTNPAVLADLKALGFDSITRLSRGHHPSLPYKEMPSFFSALQGEGGIAAKMLQVMILTNLRTGSVRLAEWHEINFADKVWVVPVAHLKDRKSRKFPMRVPLTKPVISILKEMMELRINKLIFPQKDDKPFSDAAMLAVIHRMNRHAEIWIDHSQNKSVVPHGFRSTFNVWSTKNRWDHDLVELAMGHVIARSTVERAYNRTDLLEERRPLMQAWTDWCLGNEVAP